MGASHEPERVAIVAGAVHHREVELEAEDFLHVVVVQDGIDVEVRLKDALGKTVRWVDSPNGTRGPEELLVVVPTAGRHRIEVVAPEGVEPGHYTFKQELRRPATDEDRELVTADHAYHDGRRLAEKKQALELYLRALSVWQRRSLPHREADTVYALCQAHQSLGHGRLALVFCNRAVELYRTTEDGWMLAFALDRVGWLRLRLGQAARAVESLAEGLALYEELHYERGAVMCMARLGAARHQLGQLRHALDALEGARDRSGSEPTRSRASILVDLADLFMTLNRLDDAFAAYSEAVEIYRQLEHGPALATALERVANTAARLGRYKEAEKALDEAFPLLGDPGKASRHTIAYYETLGRLRRLQDELGEARESFGTALDLARRGEDRQAEAYFLMELGHVLVLQGDAAAGLERIERAIAIFVELDNRQDLASARARSAEALRELGRLEEARIRIALALDDVEALRNEADRQDVRTSYFAFRQEYYDVAIDILLLAGRPREAFEVHERRLARELRETLASPPEPERGTDPARLAEEHALEQRLRELAVRIPLAQLGTNEEVREALAGLHRLWGETDPGDPGKRAEPRPLKFEEVRELLDEDSVLLVYTLGERRGIVWWVDSDGDGHQPLPDTKDLEALVKRFAAQLADARPRSQERQRETGRWLSETLLAPVAEHLGRRRLIVVPDPALRRIPFAALPKPGTDGEHLIREHEVVVLPSLSTLAQLREAEAERAVPRDAVAIFADPVFTTDDPRLHGDDPVSSSSRQGDAEPDRDREAAAAGLRGELERLGEQLDFDLFERLEGTHREGEKIFELASPGPHLLEMGFDASRKGFLALSPGQYRTLHIATHGIASSEHPELSGVVLSLVDKDGRFQDGYLRAYEIARLDLPLELVVLSACRTGVGKELAGEGVLGLARAFLDAGATRVVSSLWKVNDRHTAALMTHFYEAYLREGVPPAAALRRAQLSLLEDPQSAAPYAWAAFVFQGDWRMPARSEKN